MVSSSRKTTLPSIRITDSLGMGAVSVYHGIGESHQRRQERRFGRIEIAPVRVFQHVRQQALFRFARQTVFGHINRVPAFERLHVIDGVRDVPHRRIERPFV